MGNESKRLRCWLEQLDSEIRIPFTPDEVDGWGVGYYYADRALSNKRPHTARPWKFSEEMKGIESKIALWHILPRPENLSAPLDEQPLHYGRWLLTSECEPDIPADAREELSSQLASHFQRRIKSHSSNEYLFYWLLQNLQREGWLERPPDQLPPLVELVQSSICHFSEQWLPDGKMKSCACCLTNGRILLVLAQEPDMYISFKEGLADCDICADELDSNYSLRQSHSQARAIFVIQGLSPESSTNTWQTISPRTVIAIDRDMSIHHFRWPDI